MFLFQCPLPRHTINRTAPSLIPALKQAHSAPLNWCDLPQTGLAAQCTSFDDEALTFQSLEGNQVRCRFCLVFSICDSATAFARNAYKAPDKETSFLSVETEQASRKPAIPTISVQREQKESTSRGDRKSVQRRRATLRGIGVLVWSRDRSSLTSDTAKLLDAYAMRPCEVCDNSAWRSVRNIPDWRTFRIHFVTRNNVKGRMAGEVHCAAAVVESSKNVTQSRRLLFSRWRAPWSALTITSSHRDKPGPSVGGIASAVKTRIKNTKRVRWGVQKININI